MPGNKKRKIDGGLHMSSWAHPYKNVPSLRVKPTFVDVFDRHTCYPFFSRLCDYLSVAEIYALTMTCKKYANLYQYLLPIQWDVDRRLRLFVKDPYGFRSQMAKHDALISGSFVVQYFERVTWKDSDLDVFIKHGESADVFGRYLVSEEEYAQVSSTENAEYELHGYEEIRTYTKTNGDETGGMAPKIQIITTTHIPIKSILRGFYSTVLVNIMSWNKAYSAFPLSTFVQHKGYQLKALDEYFAPLVSKYSRRGWNMQEIMWPEERRVNHPIRKHRRIGDRFTWTIPFNTKGIKWSKTPDYVLEHACFRILCPRPGYPDPNAAIHEHRGPKYFYIDAEIFHGPTLKYAYLHGGDDLVYFLGIRVDQSTLMELRKLEPSARPANYDNLVQDPRRFYQRAFFPKPDSWTYRDDELPGWYKAWEQAGNKLAVALY